MQDMKITYIGHSGFAVRWDGHAAVFDYFQGEVPEFEKDTKIYVFASHAHYDHFQPCIFEWASKYPDITYILSSDIKYRIPEEISAEQVHYMKPGRRLELEEDCPVAVRTLKSTDEGVAFLIRIGERIIYHAGDLNWWHWEEESPRYNKLMMQSYQREIEKLEGRHIDVAFVPADPRQGEQYYWGLDWFMKHTDTANVFPMHNGQEHEVYERLMAQPETESYREHIMHITGKNQIFEVAFPENGTARTE